MSIPPKVKVSSQGYNYCTLIILYKTCVKHISSKQCRKNTSKIYLSNYLNTFQKQYLKYHSIINFIKVFKIIFKYIQH